MRWGREGSVTAKVVLILPEGNRAEEWRKEKTT